MGELSEWGSWVGGGVGWVGELGKWWSWVSCGVGCLGESEE